MSGVCPGSPEQVHPFEHDYKRQPPEGTQRKRQSPEEPRGIVPQVGERERHFFAVVPMHRRRQQAEKRSIGPNCHSPPDAMRHPPATAGFAC